jgi:hypothetical protein
MSFDLTCSQKATFLHAVATGENTKENVMGYLRAVLQECLVRKCTRVLIEERLEGPRLGPVDVFDIAVQGSGEAGSALEAIAYVDVNAVAFTTMTFAENVAVNRGLPVRIFATVADAEKWLAGAAIREGSPRE